MKIHTILLAGAIASLSLAMAACGGERQYTMTMDIQNNTAVINLNKADTDDFVSAGGLEVGENQEVTIEPAIDGKGKVNIQLIPSPEDQTISELPELDEPYLDVNVEASDSFTAGLPAGSYQITATALSKTTGTILINVNDADTGIYTLFETADSAEEAAKAAGFDDFVLPMDAETDLGKVSDSQDYMHYRYLGELAQVDFPMAAVDMVIRKAPYDITSEADISGDYVEYAYEWTQDVDGVEVKCSGNREGDATKAIWINKEGTFCYSINAHGAGGDDDFGLSAEDVAIWVKGIR